MHLWKSPDFHHGEAFKRSRVTNDTVTYGYDDLNRKNSMTMGASYSVGYSYDPLGRMKTVSSGTYTFKYDYEYLSTRVTSLKLNDNEIVNNTYDVLGRLVHKLNKAPNGSTVNSYIYELNNSDERTKVIISGSETDILPNGRNSKYITYEYDLAGQLISAQRYDSAGVADATYKYGYDFDPMGNRKSYADRDEAFSRQEVEIELWPNFRITSVLLRIQKRCNIMLLVKK